MLDDCAMNSLRIGPATSTPAPAISDIVTCRPSVHIVILQVPHCPLGDQVRATVNASMTTARIDATIEKTEGVFASPTLLIDGVEVIGATFHDTPSCRLDLPREENVLVALGAFSPQEHAV